MRNLVDMTDAQIEDAFEDIGIGLNVEEKYGCEVVFTRDTIDDFINAAKNYNEHGKIERRGNTLVIHNVQVRKGETRNNLYVIDFGEVRGAHH